MTKWSIFVFFILIKIVLKFYLCSSKPDSFAIRKLRSLASLFFSAQQYALTWVFHFGADLTLDCFQGIVEFWKYFFCLHLILLTCKNTFSGLNIISKPKQCNPSFPWSFFFFCGCPEVQHHRWSFDMLSVKWKFLVEEKKLQYYYGGTLKSFACHF